MILWWHRSPRSAAGGKGGSRSRLLAARAEGETRRFMHSQMLRDDFRRPVDWRPSARLPARRALDPKSEAIEVHARRRGL